MQIQAPSPHVSLLGGSSTSKNKWKEREKDKKIPLSILYFHINRSPVWSGLLDEFWIDLPAGSGWLCIWTGLLRVCCSTSRATYVSFCYCYVFAVIELDVQFHYKKYLNLRCQYFVCYFYAAALNCLCYVNATLPELDIIATVEPLHAILSLSKGFTLQCHCHCLSFLSLSNLLSSCTCLKPLVKRKIWRSCKHINQEKTLLFCLLLLIHNWLGELLLLLQRRQHVRSHSSPKLQCIAL